MISFHNTNNLQEIEKKVDILTHDYFSLLNHCSYFCSCLTLSWYRFKIKYKWCITQMNKTKTSVKVHTVKTHIYVPLIKAIIVLAGAYEQNVRTGTY